MAIAVQSKAADPMLSIGSSAQSGSSSNSQSVQNGQDFGGMVRQKQQEIRQNNAKDSGRNDGKNGEDSKGAVQNGSTAVSARQQQEIPHEQYILAAALIFIPTVETFTVETLPEETEVAVEIQPTFVPDMQIESLTDLPVTEVADDGGEALFENRQEALPETFEVVEETPAEYTPGTGTEEVRDVQEEEEMEDPFGAMEDVTWETPVFGYMDASPVKVSSPVSHEQPVELEADDGMEQLSARIEPFVMEEPGVSRVEFTLIPASLGKVTVEITRAADGSLHIQLNTTTLRASELLQRNTGNLQHLLGSDTRPEVRVEVRSREEAASMYLDPNGDRQDQRRQQQNQRQQKEERRGAHQAVDFLQQLRLGLVELGGVV